MEAVSDVTVAAPSCSVAPFRPRGALVDDLPMLRPPRHDLTRSTLGGRIPTHRECRPWRPRPAPRWYPRSRKTEEGNRHSMKGRVRTEFTAAPDLGQTRTNFSFNNHGTTTADFCDKAGRQHYGEGPHEANWRRWLRVNPYCTDVQFQPIKAVFIDEHGQERVAYWDVGVELLGSQLVFGEIKADRSFFDMPKVAVVVRLSVSALRDEGIAFARLHGTDFDDITIETIKGVFDRRRSTFDRPSHARSVIDAIDEAGGCIELGDAAAILGGHYTEAEAQLCAMMCARLIAIDLDLPLTGTTLVRRAPATNGEGALRRFLERFAKDA